MTRLSDHLRGLADRAPVADASVSVQGASRRIHRQRRMRAGANAVAGVGAAAVIAFAAINPGAASSDSMASTPEAGIAGGSQGDATVGAPEDATRLAWGTCGSYPLSDWSTDTQMSQLKLGDVPGELTGGDTLTLDATLIPASSGEVETFGPQALVLWNGMVVASGTTEVAELAALSLTAGQPVEQTASADLVDCWEGAPLPGGKYQVLAVQELYTAAEVTPPPPTDPGVDPGVPVEPTGEPGVPVDPVAPDEPGVPVEPVAPQPESGAATSGMAEAATGQALPPETVIDDTVVSDGIASDAVSVEWVASAAVDFVITGDVPEDPFGQYLPKPVEPIETPDDLLTPADARDGFSSHLTSTPWAMEAGSQRVLKVNDSADQVDDTSWAQNYFGCAWDAGQSVGFPATSATWDLLDVSASLPSRIDVSYGWVVEDNPVIDLEVTNVSGHTLPGYWGSDPNTALVLVRDGKVVAEGYPVTARRDTSVLESKYGEMLRPEYGGMLSPGDSLKGTYLWREVNGCYTGTAQAEVTPGTYTVLNVQSISVNTGVVYYVEDGMTPPPLGAPSVLEDPATSGETSVSSGSAGDAIAPVPGPGNEDWLELQVWTSFGTITVT